MTEDDVGYIGDADETFSRDFLRAVQVCPNVEFLDHHGHRCHLDKARMIAASRVFESFPDCISKGRTWHHPSMVVGACIELIGNATLHPLAPRVDQFLRAPGFGDTCKNESFRSTTDGNFPLCSAADFRRMCGGAMLRKRDRGRTEYTGYHFHNFFAKFGQLR